MAFEPLQLAGIPFVFDRDGTGAATDASMADSVVTAGSDAADQWALTFETPQVLRITAAAFERSGSGDAYFDWNNGAQLQENESPTPTTEWLPSPFTANVNANQPFRWNLVNEGGYTEQSKFLIEIDVPVPPMPTTPCQEIGRATRSYVSAYDRARIQVVRVRRQEKRCLVANFNGAIPPGRKIVSAKWSCTSPWVTYMSDASISADQRETMVMVNFQNPGWGAVKVTATMDNGEIYNQVFEGVVRDIPWFNENLPIANGPYSLIATAS